MLVEAGHDDFVTGACRNGEHFIAVIVQVNEKSMSKPVVTAVFMAAVLFDHLRGTLYSVIGLGRYVMERVRHGRVNGKDESLQINMSGQNIASTSTVQDMLNIGQSRAWSYAELLLDILRYYEWKLCAVRGSADAVAEALE